MTIGGALSELDNLLKADDIPCYYKPSIKAVMDTIALEQEPRWIPVSERLPNHDEYIKNNGLFNVSGGNRSYSEWFDIYDKQKFGEPTMSGFRVDYAVTAWMPLPEPYESQESEDFEYLICDGFKQSNKWIYRTIPDEGVDFDKIEKALGFKLFIWQKTFIARGVFRQYGETTAKCIRRLLQKDNPIDYRMRILHQTELFERQEMIRIHDQLQAAGVEVCEILRPERKK